MSDAPRVTVEFWFELASTYSYIAAGRIEPLARARGRRGLVETVPPRPDLRDAGMERLAVQPLSGEGGLYVAGHGAAVRAIRLAVSTPDRLPP